MPVLFDFWLGLDAAGIVNGCMELIPGSHLLGPPWPQPPVADRFPLRSAARSRAADQRQERATDHPGSSPARAASHPGWW